MVKGQLVEETAKGNWSGVAGLGALGLVMSIGVVPVLAIILGLLGVGLVLTVYFMPILVAGVVGGATFAIGYYFADLRGLKLVGATLLASLGSLVLFSFTDITLWGMSAVNLGQLVEGQSFLGTTERILQMVLGIIVLGFILLSLLIVKAVGPEGAGDAIVGLISATFVGVLVSSWFDIEVPGLADVDSGTAGLGTGLLIGVLVAFIVGTIVVYLSWRYD